MKTFTELITDVAVLAQRTKAQTVDAGYATKIKVWLNIGLEFLYNAYDYYPSLFSNPPFNFTSVTDQEDYGMPNDFGLPLRLYDVTNDKRIVSDTEVEYFDSNIQNIADAVSGQVNKYRVAGEAGAITQISSSGDTVQVKSSETETGTAFIEGYVDSDQTILGSEEISVTGTSAVSGTKTFYKITRWSKSKDSTGYWTLENSSGTDLGFLMTFERVAAHRIIKLGLIPDDSSTNFRMLYKRKFKKMVSDYSYPFVDADAYLTLEAYGYALSEEKETQDKANSIWQKSASQLQLVIAREQRSLGPDFQHEITNLFANAHRVS